jgi:putative transposase
LAERDKISDKLWTLGWRRKHIIAPLARQERVTQHEITEAARKLNLGRAMVFRLVGRYRREYRTSALIPETSGRKPGSRILEGEQEQLIQAKIADFYLCPERPTVAALHREILVASHKAGVSPPSYKTVRRRVAEFDRSTLLKKRYGAKEAAQRLSPVREGLLVSEPLQLVQIDHTLVDVIVVDEIERKPIGRPWLTLAVDVATRMVPGFHLTLEAPCATSVALALSMAVLPKERLLAKHGLNLNWPCHGLPECVHLDNAREFYSKALKRGCQEYGIEIRYRPPGRPHLGGPSAAGNDFFLCCPTWQIQVYGRGRDDDART